jgi:chaperonin cofactor prefoldin
LLAVAAVLALVSSIHYFQAVPTDVAAASADGDHGRAALRSTDLAALARRYKALQDQTTALRQQLATVQAQATVARDHASTLGSMLAGNSLTQTPVFLQDESTVRALQGIIREAAGPESPGRTTEDNLGTAATIARERLRQKFETLRENLDQQATRLETQADELLDRIRSQSAEMEALETDINRRLQAKSASGG